MKHKPLILWCIVLIICGVGVGLACRPSPSLRFVGFQQGKHGPVATFQIVNDTGSPFITYGYGAVSPFYRYKALTPAGWKVRGPGWCGTGAGPHLVAPHSVTEIQVPPPFFAPGSAFALGIHFERGTVEQFAVRGHSRSFFARTLDWLHEYLDPNFEGPEPTWSAVVSSPEGTAAGASL